jgi:hypothetical protein
MCYVAAARKTEFLYCIKHSMSRVTSCVEMSFVKMTYTMEQRVFMYDTYRKINCVRK